MSWRRYCPYFNGGVWGGNRDLSNKIPRCMKFTEIVYKVSFITSERGVCARVQMESFKKK